MITQETKEIIEKDAADFAAGIDERYYNGAYAAYIAGATRYAEKVEEERKLTDNWIQIAKEKNEILADQLESKDQELSRLKVITEKMKEALNGSDRLNDNSKDVREALTAYAEYCKEK